MRNKLLTKESFKQSHLLFFFQTLYMITSNIIPGNDNKTCKVGNVCHLDFSVINIDTSNTTSSESQLLYEVVVDHLMWAVCGRVTGNYFISLLYQLAFSLQVKPPTTTFLFIIVSHLF